MRSPGFGFGISASVAGAGHGAPSRIQRFSTATSAAVSFSLGGIFSSFFE